MRRVLLGVTGSVAALRTPALFAGLTQAGHSVKVVATEPALHFFDAHALPVEVLIRDADEWGEKRYERGDPVLHIELRKWAEVFLIAPLDANTLAKLGYGLADNCLTCVARAWDLRRPLLLAPAMNTLMWQHPVTARNLLQIAGDFDLSPPAMGDALAVAAWINQQPSSLRIVGPIEKGLACGDIGQGGMADVADLVAAVGGC